MPLKYYPREGEIVVCDYHGFTAPEMTKARPVIIVSPRLRRRGELASIVPLSTTAPDSVENYHCRIELIAPLPAPFDAEVMWAKCDMISTVSLSRLDRFKKPRGLNGAQRLWATGQLSSDQILNVKRAVLCGLGFSSLTIHV
ncbi:type II toxin-antitoxin system PemK/MazF family toxin [Sphingobium sp. UBA5915]|uniref:type II toxin-antitoxin system PemK/MazF family toxin n=1 Tax=Sphingobium sp. UBA5915 TaxID=1947530 RepID=UPI0039C934A9